MSRTLVLAALVGALALPASAASVKVNVAGLDAAAIHEQIVHAARTVCRQELEDQSSTVQFYALSACVDGTVADTEAKIAPLEHRYASVQRSAGPQN